MQAYKVDFGDRTFIRFAESMLDCMTEHIEDMADHDTEVDENCESVHFELLDNDTVVELPFSSDETRNLIFKVKDLTHAWLVLEDNVYCYAQKDDDKEVEYSGVTLKERDWWTLSRIFCYQCGRSAWVYKEPIADMVPYEKRYKIV